MSAISVLSNVLESAKIQGFRWNKSEYHFDKETLFVDFSEHDYNSLLARYKDLYHSYNEISFNIIRRYYSLFMINLFDEMEERKYVESILEMERNVWKRKMVLLF